MELLIQKWSGDRISTIKIGKELQKNKHSRVSLCADNSGNTYVLKTLSGGEFELYFTKELAVDYLVESHTNLIKLVDASYFINNFERSKNKYHLLYEYAPRGDMFDFLRRNYTPRHPPPQRWIAKMFLGIINGLKELHSKGIIHRDIKLENIVIDTSYTPKLCDFAFCEWDTSRRHGPTDVNDVLRKERSHILGTPGYIAPEVISQFKASISSDIFSLGILLYEITTARSAFGNFSSAHADIQQAVKPSELVFNRKCCPDLVNLIKLMTSSRTDDRPQIEEIVEFFENVLK